MINKSHFTPYHINASEADMKGNDEIGRYVFLPGSNGRAEEIAQHFDNLKVKKHARGHHLYLGEIHHKGQKIEVASIATGMGCPSLEIILHELYAIGGRRFLRVGTAGTLQSKFVNIGDLVNVSAAVRDENTSQDYMPLEVPAMASQEFVVAIQKAAQKLQPNNKIATGIVHCKNSFYAREFGFGPKGEENLAYMELLKRCGVLATEMETSALFTQAQYYNYEQMHLGDTRSHRVLAGALLGILADPPDYFASAEESKSLIERLIETALQSMMHVVEAE